MQHFNLRAARVDTALLVQELDCLLIGVNGDDGGSKGSDRSNIAYALISYRKQYYKHDIHPSVLEILETISSQKHWHCLEPNVRQNLHVLCYHRRSPSMLPMRGYPVGPGGRGYLEVRCRRIRVKITKTMPKTTVAGYVNIVDREDGE